MVYPNMMKFPKTFDKVITLSKEPTLLPPLGILYIISNSHTKIDFIDNRIFGYSDKKLFEKLKRYDIVGFGGIMTEVKQAKNVSQLLRREGIVTIYGGPNATVNWDKYIDYFDIIVKGEGEITVNGVLDCIEKGKDLDDVSGIVYKKDGKTINNPDRPFIEDLDSLKYPAREILDLEKYLRKEKPWLDVYPVDTVISSRGCPFACTFCSSKYFWKRTYRKRKAEKVVAEIEYMIEKFGTKGIYFREDLFTIPKKWVLEFCKLVKPLDIDWMCEAKVDTLNDEILKAMKGSGCKSLWFGIESSSDKTLKLIKKGFTFDDVKKGIDLCKKNGLFIGGAFMYGFPHETKEDILHTFKESRNLGLDLISDGRLIGFPKSELYDLIKKEGLNRYEYEEIIIPDTRYLHADEVTNITYYYTHSWKLRMYLKVPLKVRNFIKEKVKQTSPDLYHEVEKRITEMGNKDR
jgi:radical SAM superfamily enzyme YgiQ (UPF0313 family)